MSTRMNTALDRWGVSPTENKENNGKASNAQNYDKKKKKGGPQELQQKQQQQNNASSTVSSCNSSSRSISSKGSGSLSIRSGSRRQSGPVAELLGIQHDQDEMLDTDTDNGMNANTHTNMNTNTNTNTNDHPPPIHNVVRDPITEAEMNEVSTIAGDTFAGIEMDARVAEAVPPFPVLDTAAVTVSKTQSLGPEQELLVEQATNDKTNQNKNKNVGHNHDYDSDDPEAISPQSTQQTTPEKDGDEYDRFEDDDSNDAGAHEHEHEHEHSKKGKRGKKNRKKRNGGDQEALPLYNGDDYGYGKKPSAIRRWRCMACMGCLLAFFLLTGIAMLGYTLYAIRNEDNGALSLFSKEFWIDLGDKIQDNLFFWQDEDQDEDETAATDVLPVDNFAPTEDPEPWLRDDGTEDSGTIPPTPSDSWDVTEERTVVDAGPATATTMTTTMEELTSIILTGTVQRGTVGINGTALNDPSSIQFSVLEWLSNDPNIETYSNAKIIQRYALGCFYRSLYNAGTVSASVEETWMTYGDECTTWTTTERSPNPNNNVGKRMCDADGFVRSIHMENVGLDGTLVPELALLSDSMESVYLTKNNIHGTIPTSWGQMTNLKRLQLSRNSLEGNITSPELLGQLNKLEILGLGNNKLTGSLPDALGALPSLMYLNIPSNSFTGTIPSGENLWGGQGSTGLIHVSLRANGLTGSIPSQLSTIQSLNTLFLDENNLEGSIPSSVCLGEATFNGMNMTVDCALVRCSCCHGCSASDSTGNTQESTTLPPQSPTNTDNTINPAPVADDTIVADSTVTTTVTDQDINNGSGCEAIDVGFSCYSSAWSIDFELSNGGCGSPPSPTTDYDLVALYLDSNDATSSNLSRDSGAVGTQKSLSDALFWVSSCGLANCDGVIANAQIYYRNTYPSRTAPVDPFLPWWPIAPGSLMRLHWIRVSDADADNGIVVAESRPFVVAGRCL